MPIFKKDFLFFLKQIAISAVTSIVIIIGLFNVETVRGNWIFGYPSPLHWALSFYPLLTLIIGLSFIARVSVSERTYKTNIFLHALPVSPSQAFVARWLSIWLNLFLYSFLLLLGMLIMSYEKVSVDPAALLQLTFYISVHLVIITSICLLFEKFGRFRIIGYSASIIAMQAGLISPLVEKLGIQAPLITSNFNLANNQPWEWRVAFSYLFLSLSISAIALLIQASTWNGIPRKLSFKEKYTAITAFMLVLIILASTLTNESEQTLLKGDFSKKDIVTETTILEGRTTFTLVNPGQYKFGDDTQQRLNTLVELLESEISNHMVSFGSLLSSDHITIQLTAGPLAAENRDGNMVLSLSIEDLQEAGSADELKNALIYTWLDSACSTRFPWFAKLTNRDLIYSGLPRKESQLYKTGYTKAYKDQLHSLRQYIQDNDPEDWLNWSDYGPDLSATVAGWTLHGIQQEVGRDTYLKWIRSHTTTPPKRSYAPIIGSSILFDDMIQSVNYDTVKTIVIDQLDQAISDTGNSETHPTKQR